MFKDKLKEMVSIKKYDGNNKKIENLVFFIVILIVTIIIINIIWNGNKEATKKENDISSKKLANTEISGEKLKEEIATTDNLKEQLENILAKIQGVGKVNVFVNYSESSQIVAMYNETTKTSNTEENDTSGGIRKIEQIDSQKDIIYEEQNGEKKPITQKVIQPKVEGAIVTAEGASNAETKANIIQAVEAVTGLATHKIQVFEMES